MEFSKIRELTFQQAVELMDTLSGYETEIAAAKNAILAEDAAALYAAADAFLKAGTSEEIQTIAEYLRTAANCYETYALYE